MFYHRLFRFILCCAPLAALNGCGRLHDMNGTTTDNWVQFTSKEAAFTASYPSPPTDKPDPDGVGHAYKVSYDNGERYLGVVYSPNADVTFPLAERCAAMRDKLHIVNLSVSEVEVDGQKGLEADYQRDREGVNYTSRMRMFYVKGALYQIDGVITTSAGGQDDVNRFYASFHFLPDKAH